MFGECQASADQGAGSGSRNTGQAAAPWKFGTSQQAMMRGQGVI